MKRGLRVLKKTNEREPEKVERPEWFVSANDLTPEDHVYGSGNNSKIC